MARTRRFSFLPLLLVLGGCGTHAIVGVEGEPPSTGTCLGTCPTPAAAGALSAIWSEISDVAVDEDGDVYLAGDFAGNLHLAGVSLTAEPPDEGPYKNDGFLIKVDAAGASPAWGQRIGGLGAFALAPRAGGGVVSGGSFFGQLTLQPDDEPYGGDGPNDLIVADYRADGTVQTATVHSGNAWIDRVLVAADGDRVLVGSLDGSTTIGSTTIAPASTAPSSPFVVRLDPQGTVRWARIYQQWVSDARLLADGSLALVGGRELTAGAASLPATGTASDTYLALVDDAGATLWARPIDPTPDQLTDGATANGATVREGPTGSLWVTTTHTAGTGFADEVLHLQSYGRDGSLLSHADVGSGALGVHTMAIAPDGDVLLWGGFSYPARIAGEDLAGADAPYALAAGYLTRLAPDGTRRWTRTLEASATAAVAAPFVGTGSMRVAPSGRIVVTGAYGGILAIGGTTLPATATDNQNAFYAFF